MTDRAHIRNGQIVRLFSGEKGWLTLEDGKRASPAVIGYRVNNDRVVPAVHDHVDNSTGPDTVTEDTGWQVEAGRVYRVTTKRDMTQAELDERERRNTDAGVAELDERKAVKALAMAIWHIRKGTVPAGVFDSPSNYKAWLRSLM